MRYFRNEGRHGTGNLKNDQPPLDKNSEDLAILILEFDNVTVKTSYCFLSSLEWSSWGSILGVHGLYRPCSRPIKISIQMNPRYITASLTEHLPSPQ